jgi:hypothetical protein
MDVSLKSIELKWQRRVYRKEINFEGDISGTTALWDADRAGKERGRITQTRRAHEVSQRKSKARFQHTGAGRGTFEKGRFTDGQKKTGLVRVRDQAGWFLAN